MARLIVASVAATLSSLLFLTIPASAKQLNAYEVRKLFPGSYTVRIFDEFDLRVLVKPNGVIMGEARGRKDTGRWSIEGKRLCVSWSTLTAGRKGCSALRVKDGLIRGQSFSFRG